MSDVAFGRPGMGTGCVRPDGSLGPSPTAVAVGEHGRQGALLLPGAGGGHPGTPPAGALAQTTPQPKQAGRAELKYPFFLLPGADSAAFHTLRQSLLLILYVNVRL